MFVAPFTSAPGMPVRSAKAALDYFAIIENSSSTQMRPETTTPAHQVFRALSHPARVRVVRELSEGKEKCVCDLVEACGLGWSTVSRHLSVLRDAGVIADEKRGLQVFYRLTLTCVSRFIDCLDHPRRHHELQPKTPCCR